MHRTLWTCTINTCKLVKFTARVPIHRIHDQLNLYLRVSHFSTITYNGNFNMELLDAFFKCHAQTSDQSRDAIQTQATIWRGRLIQHYGEEQRHYHTMQHITDMSNLWQHHRQNLKQPELVALAILFHE